MVTVIIPTYKRAEYIDKAINSVLNQTYKDFEIIVVDDNNPDTVERKELEEKMEKYKDNNKIIYIQHSKNKNGAAARNTGIKVAKGDYITFLDDDDYFFHNRLEKMVRAMEENLEYNAAYSGALYIRSSKILNIIKTKGNDNFQKDLLMQKSFFGTGSNMFFRAECLKKLNGFDERFARHQDTEVMIRYFNENDGILAVDDILVVKNDDDRKNIPNIDKYLNVKKLFFDTFKNEINKQSEDDQKEIYYLNYKEVYTICLRNKQYKEAKKIKKMMKQFKKISIKERIYFLYNIFNSYIPIYKLKYKMVSNKNCKMLDSSIIEEIKSNLFN